MRTENDFNAKLGKELKKLSPSVKFIKASDRFTIGVSDFLIWAYGKNVGVESKLIKEYPVKGTSKLLSRPFTGAQRTFLNELEMSGSKGYGLVAVKSEKKMYLIRSKDIPKSGNWTLAEFNLLKERLYSFKFFDEVPVFVEFLFGY